MNWVYDHEANAIKWIGPARQATPWDWFVWLAQWAALIALALAALAILAIFLTWVYAQVTIILSNRHMIYVDAQGRLPVNRAMVQAGAMVQAAHGLIDPNLIRPDQRGLLPVAKQLLESGALNDALLTLAAEYVKAQRPQPNVPVHLTYAPHTSNDRALDVSLAQGLGATGGGAFQLLADAATDKRFTVTLPEQLEIPFEQTEVNTL